MAKYKCKHCNKVVTRDSDKFWIKSWCADTQRMVRLIRQKEQS